MKRRTRALAGTLALVAMTFALAEKVLASTCVPGMDMHTADAVAPEAAAEDCMQLASGGPDREQQENDRHCPFGPAATAQACAGVASLPANGMNDIAASFRAVVGVYGEQAEHTLLLANALFHPPRA